MNLRPSINVQRIADSLRKSKSQGLSKNPGLPDPPMNEDNSDGVYNYDNLIQPNICNMVTGNGNGPTLSHRSFSAPGYGAKSARTKYAFLRSPEVQDAIRNQVSNLGGLPPKVQQHFDPQPVRSWAVSMPGTMPGNLSYQLGSSLPDMMGDRAVLKPFGNFLGSLGTNPARSLIYGMLAGGAAGAGYGLMSPRHSMFNSALLGAGLGGAGAYGLSSLMKGHQDARRKAWMNPPKQAAMNGMDLSAIQGKLLMDSNLNMNQRSTLLEGLNQLGTNNIRELGTLLRMSAGAGVGILIARYLLHLGFGGTALLSIVGGLGAGMLGNNMNVYGQNTDSKHDVFGRERIV